MSSPPATALLTIGELSTRTGLSPQLLRTWETRYGFPEPTRLPSGHRRYAEADARAVRRALEERDRGVRLELAIDHARRAESVTASGSVYAALTGRHPGLASYPLAKRTLLALSWAIEDECAALASHGILLGAFQQGRFFEHSRARWEDLARTAQQALVVADFDRHDDDASPARVALPDSAALMREWIVVHESSAFAAALVAWELPGQHDRPDSERLFEALWTVEGEVVRDTGVLVAEAAVGLGSRAAAALLRHYQESPTPASTSTPAATVVFNRVVAYADGTALRNRR